MQFVSVTKSGVRVEAEGRSEDRWGKVRGIRNYYCALPMGTGVGLDIWG